MRLLFFGTPDEAVPFLDVCASGHEVAAVVTNPDRPAGRGLKVQPSPVKALAERLGLKVCQPDKPSALAAELSALKADMAVVVAYGKILKPDVLAATKHGFMNVHFSLLPKYRGAAPVAWTLINGETTTGVTLFWLDAGMDTGPMQLQKTLEIAAADDAISLMTRLIELGKAALGEALEQVSRGEIVREAQKGDPSLAPKLKRELALVTFDRPAADINNRARGLRAGPKAYFTARSGAQVAILRSSLGDSSSSGPAGSVERIERTKGILIQCLPGRIWLEEVQPEGKRPIAAADFAHGLRLKPGDQIASK